MNALDELAGWAAANEDQLRAFLVQLDELVADQVPAAVRAAEMVRREKSSAWREGFSAALGGQMANPYKAEAGGS